MGNTRLRNWENRRCLLFVLGILGVNSLFPGRARGQTSSTGAVVGAVLDPSDATVSGATVRLVNKKTSEEQSTTSDEQERFEFQFLSSGRYELRADKASFEPLRPKVINITVTETLRIELHLRLPAMSQSTPGWGVGFYIEKFEVVGVASRHS